MEYYLGYIICGFVVVLAIIIAGIAQVKVSSAYSKYKEVSSSLDMTGGELAQKLASEHGINITIASAHGHLIDNYNSANKTLTLSEENYNSRSLASHAIVAHEFGHALQDAKGYKPLFIRQAVIKTANFISSMLLPMLIIGVLLELFWFAGVGNIVIYIYVGIYAVSVICSLVTLPVEFNASSRAKKILYEMGCNSREESEGVDRVLNAAAMTYVASLLVSLAFFMRMLFLLLSITRDR